MPSTYSTNLKFELIATGEKTGTWGVSTNANIGTLIEEAISGVSDLAMTDADTTISIANGATSTARNLVIQVTGALTAQRNLIVPTIDKPYIISNGTTGGFSIVVKTTAGTGITILNGKKRVVYADSTNVVDAFNDLPTSATIAGSTITTIDGSQTLTNKTLTSPVIATPNLDGGTIDSTPIGATTPATGAFTTLSASTSITEAGTLLTSKYVPQTRTVSPGTGLTGGGDLSANRTLSLDINGLSALTAPAVGDFLPIYDVSAAGALKITLQNMLAVLDALTEDTTPDLAADFVLSYDTSALAVKKVKPANLGVLSKSYTSADTAITVSANQVFAHAMGVVPKSVQAFIVCQTAEAGYLVGEVIQQSGASHDAAGLSFTIQVDATNITLVNAASPISATNKSTHGNVSLTAANWKWRVIAYA